MTWQTEEEFEEHFRKLRAHMELARPVFDQFSAKHGFHWRTQALGRSPRIIVDRPGDIELGIELAMNLDKIAVPITQLQFAPDLPHWLGVWALLDISGSPVHPAGLKSVLGLRLHKTHTVFEAAPFHEILPGLALHLEKLLSVAESWTPMDLIQTGYRVQLPAPDARQA